MTYDEVLKEPSKFDELYKNILQDIEDECCSEYDDDYLKGYISALKYIISLMDSM